MDNTPVDRSPRRAELAGERSAGSAFGPSPVDSEWDEGEDETDPDVDPGASGPALGLDLAAGALQAARAMMSGSSGFGPLQAGSAPARGVPRARRYRTRNVGAIYSGARPDDRDPMPIGRVVAQATDRLGWSVPLAHARIFGQWNELVGPGIAARCRPVSLDATVLRVSAETTGWATQLRLMAPQIVARICAELPSGIITKIIFTGPSSEHSFNRGLWTMSGGRGVRDTYG